MMLVGSKHAYVACCEVFLKWYEPSCHLQRLLAWAEVYTEQRIPEQTSVTALESIMASALEASHFGLVMR